MGIEFDKGLLAVKQNNYATKTVNAYIACDLNTWPTIRLTNSKFKKHLFGATNIVKNSDKSKWVYTGHGIGFDGGSSWSFVNDFHQNIIIFGVDNSSSPHADKHKNNISVLGEGPIYDVNGSFVQQRKSLVLTLLRQRQHFASVNITIMIIIFCLLTSLKPIIGVLST